MVTPRALLGGKYRVVRVLAEGGTATVLLAHDEVLDEEVAIKILRGEFTRDPERVARLQREASVAARLRSTHVARVVDVGTVEGNPYSVMEYLRGQGLDQLLAQDGPLPITEGVDFVLEAADVVAEAHRAGLVHRDLRPKNLFVAERAGGAKTIKVLDFGSSLEHGAVAASTSLPTGTPPYIAPEQCKSANDVDPRADVWSMGVVLHELLTGQLPFAGATAVELVANLLTEEPVPLSTRRPDAPPELETIVRRCLLRDREVRFATVTDLAAALAPFGSGRANAEVERIRSLGSSWPRR